MNDILKSLEENREQNKSILESVVDCVDEIERENPFGVILALSSVFLTTVQRNFSGENKSIILEIFIKSLEDEKNK
jgi:hypothetical protein